MTAFTTAPPQQQRRSPTGGYQRIPGYSGNAGMSAPTAAAMGRYGDTELAHVNPQEAAFLEARGGSGTVNPATGLREYFNPAMIPAFMAAGRAASAATAQAPAGGRHAAMHQHPGVGTAPMADRQAMGQQLLQAVLSGSFEQPGGPARTGSVSNPSSIPVRPVARPGGRAFA